MISKKLFVYVFITTLFFSSMTNVDANVSDLEVSNMVEQYDQRLLVIQQLQTQEVDLQSQLSTINQQIFDYDTLAKQLQPEIDKVNSKIASIQKAKDELQRTIESRNDTLKNRITTMYTSGNLTVSYLEVLFGSTNFSDFINRASMLTMIIKQDEQVIENLTEEQTNLYNMNEELQQQQNLHVTQQNTLQEAKTEQEKMVKERLVLLDQLQQQRLSEVDIAQKEAEDLSKIDAQLTPGVEEQLKSALEKKISSDGVWDWPVPSSNLVTSDYGPRGNDFHAGIDIAAPIGTSIVSVDNGVVLYSGKASGFGNWIVIKHADGLLSIYGHMFGDGIFVSVGQEIKRGQVIAVVGNDGQSTGPHLHFAVATGITGNQLNYINPHPYLDNKHM